MGKTPMLHSNTERLIDYWRAQKTGRLSPSRSSIDPSDISELLPQVFMLGRSAPGQHLFRLTGDVVTAVHGRDLRRTEFLSLWSLTDRPRLAAALEAARRLAEPFTITADARPSEGPSIRLELVIAPLLAEAAPTDRFIGLYQPLSPLAVLRDRPVVEMSLIRMNAVDAKPSAPRIRLAAVDGQLVGGPRPQPGELRP